jgi:hypothetical protein
MCTYQCAPVICPLECETIVDSPGYCYLSPSCPLVCDVVNAHFNCSESSCPECVGSATTSCPDVCSAICVAPKIRRSCKHTSACLPPKCDLVCPECLAPSDFEEHTSSHALAIGMGVTGGLLVAAAIITMIALAYYRRPRVTSPPTVTYTMVASE